MIHILWESLPFVGGVLAAILPGVTILPVRSSVWRLMAGSLLIGTAFSLLAGEVGYDFATSAICVGCDTFAALSGMVATHFLLGRREVSL